MPRKKPKNKPVFLVIGLGNPGEQYRETRHNAGFHVIDRIADQRGLVLRKAFLKPYLWAAEDSDRHLLVLVKPLTFMNLSGKILPELEKRFPLRAEGRLAVICDNMDLPPGELRVKSGGGSAGHNGIKSVLQWSENPDFLRIYVGVGRPAPGVPVVQHVLEEPTPGERSLMEQAEIRAAEALLRIPEVPLERILNEYNRRNH